MSKKIELSYLRAPKTIKLHFETLNLISHLRAYLSYNINNCFISDSEQPNRHKSSQKPRIHKIISINEAPNPELQHSFIKSLIAQL